MAKPIGLRIKAVEAIRKGQTIAEVTRNLDVSVWTIRRWLKRYREGGLELLIKPRPYFTPWNIKANKIAEKVYLLKEEYPKITLLQARKRLLEQGIQLSIWYIRKIWQRYGLAGYDKKKQIAEIIPKMSFPQDVKREIDNAARILEQTAMSKKLQRF